ncbi:MAG: PTS fructose transporter subunit IIA [Pseudomonadota bacterium]
MIGIVIVAHGGLAREYLAAMEHVVGPKPGTRAISIAPDEDRSAKRVEIATAMRAVDEGQGVIVVTDVYGGTPSNLAMAACGTDNCKVLCGANLPMLIKLGKSRHLPLVTAVEQALASGRKYMNCTDDMVCRPAAAGL